jgi:hypothetical protein
MPSPSQPSGDLVSLLDRSGDLIHALAAHLSPRSLEANARVLVAEPTCCIAIEHGMSILVLTRMDNLTSAIALLRVQFEAVVRAIWLWHVATDEWLATFVKFRSGAKLKEPQNQPAIGDMLKAIASSAPPEVGRMLSGLKRGAWGPLNSYVHGGVHPVLQFHLGYSPEYATQTVVNANGLSGMAAMVLAIMSGDEAITKGIREIQLAYLDCLPPLVASPI